MVALNLKASAASAICRLISSSRKRGISFFLRFIDSHTIVRASLAIIKYLSKLTLYKASHDRSVIPVSHTLFRPLAAVIAALGFKPRTAGARRTQRCDTARLSHPCTAHLSMNTYGHYLITSAPQFGQ